MVSSKYNKTKYRKQIYQTVKKSGIMGNFFPAYFYFSVLLQFFQLNFSWFSEKRIFNVKKL